MATVEIEKGTEWHVRRQIGDTLTDHDNRIATLESVSGGGAGTTTVNFGAFPGATDATTVITGQTGILATSVVQAFLIAKDSADHSADEHTVESLRVMAGNIVAGTGFTIYATQVDSIPAANSRADSPTGNSPRIHGTWNVGWRWS